MLKCSIALAAFSTAFVTGLVSPVFASFPTAPVPLSNTGFYRQQSDPEVYLVYRKNQNYCHVQNQDQQKAFGGFQQVKSVSTSSVFNSQSIGTFSGDCGWHNGFFRRSEQAKVYRMYGSSIPEFNIGDRFCAVKDQDQMNAYGGFQLVKVVDSSSDFGRGRKYTGDCPSP